MEKLVLPLIAGLVSVVMLALPAVYFGLKNKGTARTGNIVPFIIGQYQAYIGRLTTTNGFPGSQFRSTRGYKTSSYFDVDQWLATPENRDIARLWIRDAVEKWKIQGHIVNKIAFIDKDSGPVGLESFQQCIASDTGIPTCSIRLRKWPYTPFNAIKGNIPIPGEKVVVISDVATTGGHINRVRSILGSETWKAQVELALVLLNRNEKKNQFYEESLAVVSCPTVEATFANYKKERPELCSQ